MHEISMYGIAQVCFAFTTRTQGAMFNLVLGNGNVDLCFLCVYFPRVFLHLRQLPRKRGENRIGNSKLIDWWLIQLTDASISFRCVLLCSQPRHGQGRRDLQGPHVSLRCHPQHPDRAPVHAPLPEPRARGEGTENEIHTHRVPNTIPDKNSHSQASPPLFDVSPRVSLQIRFIEGGDRAVTNFESGKAGLEARGFRGLATFTSMPFEVSDGTHHHHTTRPPPHHHATTN